MIKEEHGYENGSKETKLNESKQEAKQFDGKNYVEYITELQDLLTAKVEENELVKEAVRAKLKG